MRFGIHLRGVSLCPMLLLFCLLAPATPSAAQAAPGARLPGGGVWGAVVDAATLQPLAGATVVLDPEAGGALPAGRAEGGSFLRASRAVLSDSAGAYRFAEVPPGRYRLRITRAGYRPATFSLELRGSADSRVSVGLQMEPIALQALEVTAPTPTPFGGEVSGEAEAGGSRVRAAKRRQAANLPSDVRELTHADVVEAVTLAETDVFRALQRLPGVTTDDSYSADFWVRGAPWDQTRVYFDGLPLFNPLHVGGLLSGVNPDALGGALLYPGVQPASVGGGATAAVELASRPGGGAGELRGSADLSVASARLALEQRTASGRAAWLLAARRSYLDWLSHAWSGDDPVAYSFSDLTGRADFQIDGERSLVVSGLWERDSHADRSPDIPYNRGHWGNAAGRVSYASPLGRLRSRHTLGVSRYVSIVREPAVDSAWLQTIPSSVGRTDDRILYATLSGELAPAGTEPGGPPWRVGYEVARESNLYDGPPPAYLTGSDPDTLHMRSSLLHGAIWGERRWRATERLTVDGALRLEAGEEVRNAGALRLAPRLSARFRPTPGTALSVGVARSYQYEQALAPVGNLELLYSTTTSQLWMLAGAAAPAIRADVVTFGGEAWLGDTWLASVNGYLRRTSGIALPDPMPGIDPATAPLFVTGESRTRGAELSLRRLAGRWTASAAYTYTHAETEAAGLRFPSPTARTHTFDATTMVRAGRALRLGAAYTVASGTPYTRAYLPYEYWGTNQGECVRDPECIRLNTRFGDPYALRTPLFSRLDLLMDWSHRYRTWELGAYLQLHNALGRRSPVEYRDTHGECPGRRDPTECTEQERQLRDQFNGDIPFLPVIGFRVRF